MTPTRDHPSPLPDPPRLSGRAAALLRLAMRACGVARRTVLWGVMGLAGATGGNLAQAEKADRQQPLNIEADHSSTVDMARRVVVFNGRVVLTQGTLRILADRVELAEVGDNHRTAVARGRPEQPAQFREKRDGVEEFVEGRADLIEYDSRESLIRLSGKAVVRRLRGTQLAEEVQGETIVWNGSRETFSVAPAERTGADARSDRVRGVFIPAPAPARR
ncbi:MAG: lipopolysaccharide transport periplasmic protein LptA [Betaproteobacteria bacterium]